MDSSPADPARRRIMQALLLGAGMVGAPGCALLRDDLRPPRVSLIAVTPESGSLSEIRFRCRLRLDNPNDIALPIKGGKVALTLAGRATARGELDDKVTVPPLDSAEVDSIMSVDIMSALGVLSDTLQSGTTQLPYAVEGYVDVSIAVLGRIRFDERGELSLDDAGRLSGTAV